MNIPPPGLIILILPNAPVAMGMHQELLAKDMALTPPPRCKLVFNSTPPSPAVLPSAHKEAPSGMAAQPFQATIDPLGDIRLVQSRDGGYERARG